MPPERPEEVTKKQRSVKGEVPSSTFYEPAGRLPASLLFRNPAPRGFRYARRGFGFRLPHDWNGCPYPETRPVQGA
jgi:hypothetical protein